MSVPTQVQLNASVNQQWLLTTDDQPLPMQLVRVDGGIAMNSCYTCYSATFELPESIWVDQGSYEIRSPEGKAYYLLLAPVGLSPAGQYQMEAVFHVLIPAIETA
ncbi:DUF6916 family protein [Pseudomonas sp. UBA2684]|uniref:DUF6916 family protein n=1 Tax=Pseudomonas sp. UBA2684 TaxID=1947311 RepID=UPI000E8FF25F|nr:hypothetical protein [Pseudomonas sp. UBA2684]HBX54063.1 hypothetical protein [Pseudomonas sp.]|tara:strand:+ start:8158 stop:8472 length:315 start_codon:yes stop_codon:yes gene_type:complete